MLNKIGTGLNDSVYTTLSAYLQSKIRFVACISLIGQPNK